jgi:hypothetical protein
MLRWLMMATVCLGCLAAAPLAAQNFRMETDVFVSGQKKPICQTLTLFTETMVYDFIYGPEGKTREDTPFAEVTVFDMSAGRVILLDLKKSQKTVLTHEQLIQLTTAMKLHTTEQDAVYYFAANPEFDVQFKEAALELKLSSPKMSYVVKGQKPQQSAAIWRYQEFADWSARLNACRPGNLPPFARMELGRELARHQLVPEEITRVTVAPGRLASKRVELRSRHMVNWSLSTKDRQRIDMVSQQIGGFESVGFVAFVESEKKR